MPPPGWSGPCTTSSGCAWKLKAGDDEDESAPSYVVDAGLFRVSRIEETRQDGEFGRPLRALHVVESPETDDVFGLAGGVARSPSPTSRMGEDDDLDYDEEGDESGETPIWASDEESAEVPVRSPEPPAWTPGPPAGLDDLTLTGPAMPPPPPLPGIPGQPPAPDVTSVVARLVISSGQTVDVDRATVIGRAPETKQYSEEDPPRLVTVPSAHYEISSTHIEVRPGTGADHGTAVVTDLGSTNGTVVVQPGLGPQDLAPGEPVQLLPGALIDIGDGITIQVMQP